MKRSFLVTLVVAIAALTGCNAGGSNAVPSTPQGAAPVAGLARSAPLGSQMLGPQNGYYPMTRPDAARPLCPPTADRYAMRCFGWIRTDLRPMMVTPNSFPSGVGYSPTQIQSAYNLDPSRGAGQTVFIIDAYGYTTAAKDLAQYRSQTGLPACKLGSCFRILNEKGKSSPLPKQPSRSSPNLGWAIEQSLDLDAVSAACPKCKIVLIQTKTSSSLAAGIVAAIKLHAKIISMSFGGGEYGSADPGLPSGIVYVASAGDGGGGRKNSGGPQMPCTYAAVVCVGGTSLVNSGSSWSEAVWNDLDTNSCGGGPCGATNSACSAIVPKPSWQTDAGCKMRSAADVAADASVFTPLAVYNSLFVSSSSSSPWAGIGGTSLAAPLVAGVFGLAGNAASFGVGASAIWKNHNSLRDVTSGTNIYKPVSGGCASKVKYICVAGRGYDGPTGWGTPNGSSAF